MPTDPTVLPDPSEPCPQCGGKLTFGYGLAGGGMGAYVMCMECDFWMKKQDSETDHAD